MSVTLGEWYEYWLDTYMKDTVKQSTYANYRGYLNKHFCVLGKILLKKLEPHKERPTRPGSSALSPISDS